MYSRTGPWRSTNHTKTHMYLCRPGGRIAVQPTLFITVDTCTTSAALGSMPPPNAVRFALAFNLDIQRNENVHSIGSDVQGCGANLLGKTLLAKPGIVHR